MERLTAKIKRPDKEDLIVYTKGTYEDTIPAEMTKNDIRAILKKLAAYEDAEEQGLLLRLPCKVGDIVWEVNTERKRISKFLIETITVYPCNVIQFNWTLLEGIYKNVVGFSKAELGTTVFLTREDAEAKLKEM